MDETKTENTEPTAPEQEVKPEDENSEEVQDA